MNETSKRRLFAVVAIGVAASAVAAMSMSTMGEDLVYYWSPSELMEKKDSARDATVRIMGQVEKGSVDWQPESQLLKFRVSDGDTTVAVEGKGAPPQMFREGIGVVVEGTLHADGVFRSYEVLVKHNNEYQAPSEGEMPEEVYRSLIKEDS